ncbi:acyl-CoA dehydrogenase family protein [Streptomyces spectabilis]|uniref:Acyl-CoA dehydrogenase n=1 Tax=Streptomyces spectabilis TaxID=68270 RepID=A0A5P2XDL0_STRST|nr:acyl-CoA dehydrogenase family protein [Streptomyces spectabilis]MBB5106753.1 alkylation response protein AidB-like acyl-CoA dehydrogenase [Streptomyces spectabilis]MCI3903394.1 acyl-CoA/acyl-ACP dehydrogenase [Streptomyces spectabilis]QEV60606.1 acyl-CoA dehydrogenase [Streptomyces spectabilis]GGV43636.1 acyl-CoA dehydrogenase [Streptomyces spectabilis]
MDAACTVEQDEIRRAVREVVTKRRAADGVRAAVRTPAGYDAALWGALAGRLGLSGLALPEEYGGAGCGVTELALAGEELGRTLAPSPLFATAVLAAPLLLRLGTDGQRAALLPRVASGDLTAALAVPGAALGAALGLTGDNGGAWAGGGRAGGVQATAATGSWRLYGQVDQVLDGHSAGLLLVAAHTGGFARSRTLLFLVRGEAPGLVRTRRTALDETRARARLELRDVEAELLGEGAGDDVLPALADVGERAAAVLAAEAVGAADEALARTLGHVKEREQFGRPVGSFQAVKHRLADVYVAVCAARSAAYYAAWAAGAAVPPGLEGVTPEPVAGIALACALDALRTAASEAVQLHGGIGFTWEHDAHLFFKRASGDELLFGPAHRLRAYAAERAGLFTGQADAVASARVAV